MAFASFVNSNPVVSSSTNGIERQFDLLTRKLWMLAAPNREAAKGL